MRVLFVCTGNINRSSVADVILREVEGFEVKSCGTGKTALKNCKAAPRMRRSAVKYGFDLEQHRTTPISRELVEWADVVVAMGNPHRKWVENNCPDLTGKVQQWDIPDPHFDGDSEACDRCLVAIRDKVDEFIGGTGL